MKFAFEIDQAAEIAVVGRTSLYATIVRGELARRSALTWLCIDIPPNVGAHWS